MLFKWRIKTLQWAFHICLSISGNTFLESHYYFYQPPTCLHFIDYRSPIPVITNKTSKKWRSCCQLFTCLCSPCTWLTLSHIFHWLITTSIQFSLSSETSIDRQTVLILSCGQRIRHWHWSYLPSSGALFQSSSTVRWSIIGARDRESISSIRHFPCPLNEWMNILRPILITRLSYLDHSLHILSPQRTDGGACPTDCLVCRLQHWIRVHWTLLLRIVIIRFNATAQQYFHFQCHVRRRRRWVLQPVCAVKLTRGDSSSSSSSSTYSSAAA